MLPLCEGGDHRGMVFQYLKRALGAGYLHQLYFSVEKPFFRGDDFEFHGAAV